MTDSTRRYRLAKRQKLRKPVEFRRVYDAKTKAGDCHLLVFASPNEAGVTRFGLSVSKKHGSAVKRNRIKRLLREAFRVGQHELPAGLDLILIPRPASGATLADYRSSLAGCVRRIAQRLPKPQDPQSRDRQKAVNAAPDQRPKPLPDGRGSDRAPDVEASR